MGELGTCTTEVAATQVAFVQLLCYHGAVTGTGILVAEDNGGSFGHAVTAWMVMDNRTLLAALVDEMGETAEN